MHIFTKQTSTIFRARSFLSIKFLSNSLIIGITIKGDSLKLLKFLNFYNFFVDKKLHDLEE